jgi:hypothetical protein
MLLSGIKKKVFNNTYILRLSGYFFIRDIIFLYNIRLENNYLLKLYYY